MPTIEPIGLLERTVDLLRRMDPAWCAAHEAEPATDAEYEAVLTELEDALDEAAEPPPSFRVKADAQGAAHEPAKTETVARFALTRTGEPA
jgi:hypothetical protein